MSDLPLPVDAVAFDDCETLHVDREMLLAMMWADGNVAVAVVRLVAKHADDTVNPVRMKTEASLNARVLGVLRHLALVNGSPYGPAAWALAVSQRDIAGAVGASRQRVNPELRALEEAGHIQLGYNRVIVIGTSWATSSGWSSWPSAARRHRRRLEQPRRSACAAGRSQQAASAVCTRATRLTRGGTAQVGR